MYFPSKWPKMVQKCANSLVLSQNYPKIFNIVKLFEIIFPIVQYDPIWSIMVQNYIIWSLMVQHIPILQKNEKKKNLNYPMFYKIVQNCQIGLKLSNIVFKKRVFIPPKKYKTVKKKLNCFPKWSTIFQIHLKLDQRFLARVCYAMVPTSFMCLDYHHYNCYLHINRAC